jgi:hypothetical protein
LRPVQHFKRASFEGGIISGSRFGDATYIGGCISAEILILWQIHRRRQYFQFPEEVLSMMCGRSLKVVP